MCVPFVRNLLKSAGTLSGFKLRIIAFTADVRLHPGVSMWLFNVDIMADSKR